MTLTLLMTKLKYLNSTLGFSYYFKTLIEATLTLLQSLFCPTHRYAHNLGLCKFKLYTCVP